MSSESLNNKAKNEMLNYLETKYGAKFVIKQFVPSGNSFNRPIYDEGFAYLEENPLKPFRVQRYKNEDAEGYSFADGYTFRLAEDEFSLKIIELANKVFEEYKLSSNIDTLSHITDYPYNRHMIIEDFFNHENDLLIGVRVFINHGSVMDRDKEAEKVYTFMSKMLENKYYGFVDFLFVDSDNFVKIDPQKLAYTDLEEVMTQFDIKHETFSKITKDLHFGDSREDIIKRFEN